ncbi:FecR family protein [Azospirillum sp. RWY-5-1]|uniref:FecR family protein n=1 Tax=Azospirillum oleiclasticum TaxID=2735135 RepID=A0ABX2TKZ8_9PROT|nr:FecR family protein [Azospirillum oleiclasticum]NYZ14333.1 FecR family protein [Azospirillum oleiclasticum]NYZ23315.1 FecR family protein [Azospirillum oleiclasticum]
MRVPSSGPGETGGHRNDLVEEAAAWFVRMRSDPVSDADRRAFSAWLARDPAHAAAYAEAEALWDEVGDIPDPRVAPGAGPGAPVWFDRRRALRLVGRLAAGVAAVAAVAMVGLWSAGGYDRLRADHATAVGETRTVTLPDGSTADLNTGTAIAVDFSPTRRRIELFHGEAFFTVAKDVDRPFDVVARDGTSRAVGTAFDVRVADEAVTVSVAEGRVRVTTPSAVRAGNDGAVLGAGEAARYDTAGGLAVHPDDTATATAWRQGRLVFANRPLRDVMVELDRHRPGIILILDPGIAQARFTGAFTLRDTDRALDAIEAALPVDVIRITPYLTLLRARG